MLLANLLIFWILPSGPTDGWASQLEAFQRGMSAQTMGYLDVGQIQNLDPSVPIAHPTAGDLEGFREIRRVTAILLGPDSAAPVRIGLEGSWESEGWSSDLYVNEPPDPSLVRTSWSFGIANGWVASNLFVLGGMHHSNAADWTGAGAGGGHGLAPETDGWGVVRWKRAGLMGAVDGNGLGVARGAFLSDPAPLGKVGPWFLPLLEGAVWWERADWNRWSPEDAEGIELRVPVMRDRIQIRSAGGSDGFRFVQVASDVDPQGQVGLDASLSRRGGRFLVGGRLRLPLLTFSINDPDDVDEFSIRGSLVWSMRFRMVWEDGQTWYAPGRRPAPRPSGVGQ